MFKLLRKLNVLVAGSIITILRNGQTVAGMMFLTTCLFSAPGLVLGQPPCPDNPSPSQTPCIDRITKDPSQYSSITFQFSGVWTDACFPQPPRLVKIEGNTVEIEMNIPTFGCTTSIKPAWRHSITINAPKDVKNRAADPDPRVKDYKANYWNPGPYTLKVTGYSANGSTIPPVMASFTIVETKPLETVSAASFEKGPFAANSIVTMYGERLAAAKDMASSSAKLPITLDNGTKVEIAQNGNPIQAQLFYVDPGQFNVLLPSLESGSATIIITSSTGAVSIGSIEIATKRLDLFSANSSGRGVAAGQFFLGVQQTYEDISIFSNKDAKFLSRPLPRINATESVSLILYGTGIAAKLSDKDLMDKVVTAKVGGEDVEVQEVGPVPFDESIGFKGITQVKLLLPRKLLEQGELGVQLEVNGTKTQSLTICTGCTFKLTPVFPDPLDVPISLTYLSSKSKFNVETQLGCRWQTSSQTNDNRIWLAKADQIGIGNTIGADIRGYDFPYNPTFNKRMGTLKIFDDLGNTVVNKEGTIVPPLQITQLGFVCEYTFSEKTKQVDAKPSKPPQEALFSIGLKTNEEEQQNICSGQLIFVDKDNKEIIKPGFVNVTTGLGAYKKNSNISFGIAENAIGGVSREATVAIIDNYSKLRAEKDKTPFSIIQAAAKCTLTSIELPTLIGPQSSPNNIITIKSNGVCDWTITNPTDPKQNWLKVAQTSGTTNLVNQNSPTGEGTSATTFSSTSNLLPDGRGSADYRTSSFQIVGLPDPIITQKGYACMLRIDRSIPREVDYPKPEDIPYKVTTNGLTSCPWGITATDITGTGVLLADWLTSKPPSGVGLSTDSSLTISANPFARIRKGKVSVALTNLCDDKKNLCGPGNGEIRGVDILIDQKSAPCTYNFKPQTTNSPHLQPDYVLLSGEDLGHQYYPATLSVNGAPTCVGTDLNPVSLFTSSSWLNLRRVDQPYINSSNFDEFRIFYTVEPNMTGMLRPGYIKVKLTDKELEPLLNPAMACPTDNLNDYIFGYPSTGNDGKKDKVDDLMIYEAQGTAPGSDLVDRVSFKVGSNRPLCSWVAVITDTTGKPLPPDSQSSNQGWVYFGKDQDRIINVSINEGVIGTGDVIVREGGALSGGIIYGVSPLPNSLSDRTAEIRIYDRLETFMQMPANYLKKLTILQQKEAKIKLLHRQVEQRK